MWGADVNLHRLRLCHVLVILSLLLGAVPPAQAAPATPTAALRVQLQNAHQQNYERTAFPTRARSTPQSSLSARSSVPSTQQDTQKSIEPPATLWMPTIQPDDASAAQLTTTHRLNVSPASQSTPTPNTPTSPESRPGQTRIYLPFVQQADPSRTTSVKLTAAGGQVRSPDGTVILDVPAGAVSEDVWVTLTQDSTHPPIGARHSLGVFFELTAQTGNGRAVTHFNQPLTLRVRYTPGAGPAGMPRSIFYYDEQQGIWLPLPTTTDDAAAGLLTATTDHFTQFAAMSSTSGVTLIDTSFDRDGNFSVRANGGNTAIQLHVRNFDTGATFVVTSTQNSDQFRLRALPVNSRLGFHFTDTAGNPLSFAGYDLSGLYSYRAYARIGHQPLFVGQKASSWDIFAAMLKAFNDLGGNAVLGPPDPELVHRWGGYETQGFMGGNNQPGSVIIYNADRCAAYQVKGSILDTYMASGGPGGWLGPPISNELTAPSEFHESKGMPISYFKHGIITRSQDSDEFIAQKYYPQIGEVTVSFTPISAAPTPPPLQLRGKVRLSVRPVPGEPNSLEKLNIKETDQVGPFTEVAPNIYEAPLKMTIYYGQEVKLTLEAERASDGRRATAQVTIDAAQPNRTFGPFNPLPTDPSTVSCDSSIVVHPPADTAPPVIGNYTHVQDGKCGVFFAVDVSDDRAIATVVITIDGVSYNAIRGSGGLYEVAVPRLSLGSHSFTIDAVDTAANKAKPVSGSVKIECSCDYGIQDSQGYSPDPVNTYIGNFIYHYTDIKLNEPGPDLVIERFYNAQSSYVGRFGLGWTTLFDMHIVEMDNLLFSGAIVRYPDGRTVNFPADGPGFGHAPSVFDTLERNGSGYKLTRTDQTRYFFDDQGRLTRVEDRSGNALVLTYAGDQLAQVRAASSGRTLTFTSNSSGQIEQVTAPGNVTLTYTYDPDGRLTDFTDGTGVTVNYRYDPNHGLISLQTPQGHDFVTEQRFDAQGRVIYQKVGDNFINEFAYDDAKRTTILTDTYGNTITYRYDKQGRLIEQIDALGHSEEWTYNADNQRTSYTDHNGNITRYEYNPQGDLVKETNALGGVTTHEYDNNHNLLKTTDTLGRITEYEYDVQGRRTAIIDALRGRTEMRYNARGQMIEHISPRGFSTTYVYDAQGNLLEERDPLGGVTRHEYDAQGRRIRTINANGHATTYTYDANGNLLRETDALGKTKTYAYDKNNNRISETDANGNTTTYTYSRLDNLLTTTTPDGGVTTITYDDMNNRIAETDPLGHTKRWNLDKNYRVISETDALGATTLYEYDPHGNRIAVTDANGHTTRYEYDKLHRVVKIIDPLGNVTRYAYDAVGNRISETNANGATTMYEYDALNRVEREINANGFTTTYTYDADGNRTSVTDALGNVTSYEFDPLNRLISETDALGHTTRYAYDAVGNRVEVIDALGFVMRSEYDPVNRLIGQTDALGHTTRTRYDAVGNQIAVMDALGRTTRTAYDVMNRPVEVVDALGGKTLTEYDLAGRRIGVTDANRHTTRTKYDAVGRTVAVMDPLGFVERYTYDAAGNQISLTDKNNHTTRTEYDALNRIVAQTNALNFTTRFVYDTVGNQVARIDTNGHTTTYAYDALNQRVEEVNALGFPTRTEYDALGRVIGITFADGASITKAYDALGRLVAEMDAEGFTKQYGYDVVGNQTIITDALGFVTNFTYDALRRQTSASDGLGTLKQTEYDVVGNVIGETDGNGHTTRYAYDALHRQIGVTDAAGYVTRTTFDAVGNRIAFTDGNGHTTRLTYDARNQVIAETDASGNATRYEYDGVGQKVYAIDALNVVTAYDYDPVGQLVAVTLNYRPAALSDAQNNVTTRYAYDAVGNRTSITDPNGNTVTFTPDELGQLVAETDALGNTTSYVYDAVGRQVERQNADGTVVASIYDRTGLLVRTSYPDGSAVERTYDGNRNLLEMRDSTGTTRYAYDERNRPLSEETDRGRINYAYDNANNRTSVTYADGKTVEYAYAANNWLASVTNPDSSVTSYERDGIGQITRQENGNGTITTQRYDAANNLLSVETRQGDQLITSVAYEYNAINQRTQATFEHSVGSATTVTETYEQDALRRLIAQSDSNGVQTRYRYDAAGNRTLWQSNDDPRTRQPFDTLDLVFTYDAADQLVKAENRVGNTQTDYRYDANGNRIEQRTGGDGTVYDYDADNRLVSVEESDGTRQTNQREIAAMAYDGHGRRVAKSEAPNEGASLRTTSYLYDGLDPIATYETWHSAYANLYRADSGRILTMDHSDDGSAWFTQDGLGSTLALTDPSGDGTQAYRYEPYGSIAMRTGSSDVANPFTFTGQELDESTGLYHFHARDYDPATGTWLTRDPYRGTPDDPQSLHRYGYVQGNPVNLWDAWGYAAQGGTYGKKAETEEAPPLIKFLWKIKEYGGKEWSKQFESPRIPGDWPLPGFIKDPINKLLPKVDAEARVRFGVITSVQNRAYLYENAITVGRWICLSLSAEAILDLEADIYKTSMGIMSFGIEVGGYVGLSGAVEGCFGAGIGTSLDKPSVLANAETSLEASLMLMGEFRAAIEIEADAFLAEAEGEAGIRVQMEYPLLACDLLKKDKECPVGDADFALRPGMFAEVEWDVPFSKGEEFHERDLVEVQFQVPTLAKVLGWVE